jgi:hypothetical protein
MKIDNTVGFKSCSYIFGVFFFSQKTQEIVFLSCKMGSEKRKDDQRVEVFHHGVFKKELLAAKMKATNNTNL